MNYRLSGFSVERLIHFLNALGRDVEIVIRRLRSGRTGKFECHAAVNPIGGKAGGKIGGKRA